MKDKKIKIDFDKIDDISIDFGLCSGGSLDMPDYSDAFIDDCSVYDVKLGEWRSATDDELDIINSHESFVYEALIEQLY